MNLNIVAFWQTLSATPLLWMTITIAVFLFADWLFLRSHHFPLLNPVLISILVLVLLLSLTGTAYSQYFQGARFIHFLLGPATVALAVPLYRYFTKLKRMFLPLLGGLIVGSSTAILSVCFLGRWLGLSQPVLVSMMPKSVTTPIAMGISEKIGGIPSLTAVLVILTGIFGAVVANGLFAILRIRDNSVIGFSIGVASHGIGTSRAFLIHPEAGAFSGLAMGLNGALTAILIPIYCVLLGYL